MPGIVGIIIDAGLQNYFQLYLSQYHYSNIFLQQYKGLLCFYQMMQKPFLWKYLYRFCFQGGYFQELPNQKVLATAYYFAEWYHMTPRNDTAYLACLGVSTGSAFDETYQTQVDLHATLSKSYIVGTFEQDAFSEVQQITNGVMTILQDLSLKIQNSPDDLYSFRPILTGSMAEKIKTGYPDDYDFLLHMYKLEENFKDCYYLAIPQNLSPAVIKEGERVPTKEIMDPFVDVLDKYLNSCTLPTGFAQTTQIRTGVQIKPFSFVLHWRGRSFKDLRINVDIVPAIEVPFAKLQKCYPYLQPFVKEYSTYTIPKNLGYYNMDNRLSFSVHELNILQNVPQCIRCGYRLAKAMRHKEVCPPLKTDKGRYVDATDYIPSYMLKTCLLHVWHQQSSISSTCMVSTNAILHSQSVDWALKIYKKMEHFLKTQDGQIPSYFQPMGDIQSIYELSYQRGECEEKLLKEKCDIILRFTDIITKLLHKLLI